MKLRIIELPKGLTPDLAYLCGIFAGDGNLCSRKEKYDHSLKCVGNLLDEKEMYINVIGPLLNKLFGLSPKMKLFDGGTTFGFRISSKMLVQYLNQNMGLPLGKKYSKLKIPKIFLENETLLLSFIRGLFDTDGCMCFKKRYQKHPYYPVISISSKSKKLIKDISKSLKKQGFNLVEMYDYQIKDKRIKAGFTVINKLELNGQNNLQLWMQKIGFSSPKHLNKIKKFGKINSGGWI